MGTSSLAIIVLLSADHTISYDASEVGVNDESRSADESYESFYHVFSLILSQLMDCKG